MTSEQIEKAARKLCELRGIDPDRQVSLDAKPNKDGSVCDVMLLGQAWQRAAVEIVAANQVAQAIQFAKDDIE